MRSRLCTAFLTVLAVVSQARAQPVAGPSDGDRAWAEADLLLWWMRGASLPPLVTTSPPGTPIAQAGVLGTPGTTILFGNSTVNDNLRAGWRLAAGYWFDDARDFGVEADFFLLAAKDATFGANSNGNPILARPFIDVNNGLPSSERVAFPGDLTGSVQASAATPGLLGAGVLLRENVYAANGFRLDVLGGYRYLHLSDHVVVTELVTSVNPNNPNFIPVGTNIAVVDSFASRNDLHALDVGFDGSWQNGPLSLAVRARLAVGLDQQDVDIAGSTTVTVPGAAPVLNSGGLLALAGNIGDHSRHEVSLVPEVDVKLTYQVTPRLTASLGYSFLYVNRVVRAGDEIDTTINPTFIPPPTNAAGPIRPSFIFQNTTFWAQGIELGLAFQF
jgi:hypothetical protein